jgi:D-sedoheptulose 7-phosphate isomerase
MGQEAEARRHAERAETKDFFSTGSYRRSLREAAALLSLLEPFGSLLQEVADRMVASLRSGGTIFLCGNGGSASQAEHLAAELSGRFAFDRPPLAAVALTGPSAQLTAVGNDYGYASVFARPLEALGRSGDVLLALSTSGNSPNVVEVARAARKGKLFVVALTGRTGGALADAADLLLAVPSDHTPRIQEVHLLWGHDLCEIVEEVLWGGMR